jgi:hypothetical protein
MVKKSLRYEAAQVWNSLPNETRIMTSFDQFKEYINSWAWLFKTTSVHWINVVVQKLSTGQI